MTQYLHSLKPVLRRRTCKNICIFFSLIVVTSLAIISYIFIPGILALQKELAYFAELERLADLDSQWITFSHMGLPEAVEKPPPLKDRLSPLFPDVVQLSSWGWQEQLRLYPDGSAHYPSQNVWIYVAGNKTCPRGDGQELCHSFIHAFDQLIQFHHVQKPAAGAFLSFADCDISPAICELWQTEANVMVNMQTMAPCEPHMPTDGDPEFRFHCTALWRIFALPLKQMPTRSLNKFPSAFEQLWSLTSVDGFVDAVLPCNFEDETDC